ncbi:MAG: ECF-type sigma factor [Acidobacteriota bacterium]
MSVEERNFTQMLMDWNHGDTEALDALMPLIVDELRHVASKYLRGESAASTLQPTALINEVYLRLVDRKRVSWKDRAHFFSFAALTMRRILVEHARARKAAKRGSGQEFATLIEAPGADGSSHRVNVLDLDRALDKLAALDAQQARVVELRYFTGLTVNETAQAMGIGRASVTRYWALAKAYLYRELKRQ